MTASHRSFGNYPNVRNEIVGTWADILAAGGRDGDFAMPTDAYGCSAEWKTGSGWTGFIGEFASSGALAALPVAGFAPGAFARVAGDTELKYPGAAAWGGALGSPSNPYPTFEALLAAYPVPPYPAFWPFLANPLAPCGVTEMVHDGAIWKARPGQIIGRFRNLDGAPLLDSTGAGRTPGAWYEAWQSPILPDWLIPDFYPLGIQARAITADSSSAAQERMRITLRDAPSTAGDENTAFIGHAQLASAFGHGLGSVEVVAQRVGAAIRGTLGTGAANPANTGDWPLGAFGAGATRVRLDFSPGATSNVVKLFYVNLWSR